MLKGDNRPTAEAVARQFGINDVEADVLPKDKNRIVRKLRDAGKVVAMVGDGPAIHALQCCRGKGVDGGLSPTMTGLVFRVSPEASAIGVAEWRSSSAAFVDSV
jgi:hypothetical protein